MKRSPTAPPKIFPGTPEVRIDKPTAGPTRVNSDAYRDGWDRAFGKKRRRRARRPEPDNPGH